MSPLQCSNLEIDEASYTGESFPVAKFIDIISTSHGPDGELIESGRSRSLDRLRFQTRKELCRQNFLRGPQSSQKVTKLSSIHFSWMSALSRDSRFFYMERRRCSQKLGRPSRPRSSFKFLLPNSASHVSRSVLLGLATMNPPAQNASSRRIQRPSPFDAASRPHTLFFCQVSVHDLCRSQPSRRSSCFLEGCYAYLQGT
ncbi:hypothetical protein BJ322DRAFT_429157 [Thelephora terrestris]|uniref:Uncharacterized protein n=1 Tax=Thelephora terrestris TaxID=56493 RepID=A0A9P6HP46_9AGAM|nr:hypothetical protein BJ322DRAFT_429157 [Thelephora terrestris]